MKKYIIIILFFPTILFSQIQLKYAETIKVEDLKKHLTILASDSLEGRETGQKGQKMAADYIMNHFKKSGIPPYKRNTYYQKFKVQTNGFLACKFFIFYSLWLDRVGP